MQRFFIILFIAAAIALTGCSTCGQNKPNTSCEMPEPSDNVITAPDAEHVVITAPEAPAPDNTGSVVEGVDVCQPAAWLEVADGNIKVFEAAFEDMKTKMQSGGDTHPEYIKLGEIIPSLRRYHGMYLAEETEQKDIIATANGQYEKNPTASQQIYDAAETYFTTDALPSTQKLTDGAKELCSITAEFETARAQGGELYPILKKYAEKLHEMHGLSSFDLNMIVQVVQ